MCWCDQSLVYCSLKFWIKTINITFLFQWNCSTIQKGIAMFFYLDLIECEKSECYFKNTKNLSNARKSVEFLDYCHFHILSSYSSSSQYFYEWLLLLHSWHVSAFIINSQIFYYIGTRLSIKKRHCCRNSTNLNSMTHLLDLSFRVLFVHRFAHIFIAFRLKGVVWLTGRYIIPPPKCIQNSYALIIWACDVHFFSFAP